LFCLHAFSGPALLFLFFFFCCLSVCLFASFGKRVCVRIPNWLEAWNDQPGRKTINCAPKVVNCVRWPINANQLATRLFIQQQQPNKKWWEQPEQSVDLTKQQQKNGSELIEPRSRGPDAPIHRQPRGGRRRERVNPSTLTSCTAASVKRLGRAPHHTNQHVAAAAVPAAPLTAAPYCSCWPSDCLGSLNG